MLYVPFLRTRCAASVALLAFCANAFAGAVTVNDASPRGQSMQAFTAVADDPSAVFYNPAGLTQLHGTQIETNAFYVTQDQKYKNSLTQTTSHSYPVIAAPTLFVSTDTLQKVVLALGVYSPFARGASYQKDVSIYFLPQDSKLVRTDFAPTLAFNINQYVSLGFSAVVSRLQAYTDILGFRERGHGMGYTGNVGLMIKLPAQVKLGVTYRGPESITLDGHGKLMGIRGSFHGNLNLPAILSSGISWQATPSFLLSATYDYEMWSTMKRFRRHYDDFFLNSIATATFNAKNVATYRAGIRYSFNPANDLMMGISYINAAVPKPHIIPAMPDYSGTNSSIGFSHTFNPRWRMDAMYEYIYGPGNKGTNLLFPGRYATKGSVVGVGVNYTFA